MKTFIALVLLLVSGLVMTQGSAIPGQNIETLLSTQTSSAYLGPSFGINNPAGIIGLKADFRLGDRWLLGGGAGIGGWGWKLSGTAQFFLKPDMRGFAIGSGLSYASGLSNDLTVTEENSNGLNQTIFVTAKPSVTALLTGAHYFKMGRRNRFFLQYGLSLPLNDRYDAHSTQPISEASKIVLGIMAPGGIIFGFGFLFGL